jgi:hypothetical protein
MKSQNSNYQSNLQQFAQQQILNGSMMNKSALNESRTNSSKLEAQFNMRRMMEKSVDHVQTDMSNLTHDFDLVSPSAMSNNNPS